MVTMGMVIVAGHLIIDPDERDGLPQRLPRGRRTGTTYRRLPGLRGLSADVLDAGRINVFERWENLEALEAFRGDGVQGEQAAAIRAAQGVRVRRG